MTFPDGQRVVLSELGETPLEAIERFMSLEVQRAPDPATLAPDDVIVAIKSAAVGWVDLIMASGQYQHALKPPYTPGLEYAGVVAWAGPAVTHVQVGARVLVDPFLAGPRSLGAYQRWGGFASYAVAPAAAVIAVPGALSLDQACNLLGNYETAYHCLVTRGRLAAGETVLVLGASGATGLAAVQLAKHLGATVIAVGRSADKLAAVRDEGADHTIVLDGRTLKDAVRALVPDGVDVVYDAVGGETSAEALRALRFGGRFVLVGWAATPFVADGKGRRGSPNVNVLPTNIIMMKSLEVIGAPTAIASTRDPSLRPPRLAAVLALAAAGVIRPRVSQVFALADFEAALQAKWRGGVVGGAVVRPDGVIENAH